MRGRGSEVVWLAYGLRPVGEVTAPDRATALRVARRVLGADVQLVRSRADVALADEEARIQARDRRPPKAL